MSKLYADLQVGTVLLRTVRLIILLFFTYKIKRNMKRENQELLRIKVSFHTSLIYLQ